MNKFKVGDKVRVIYSTNEYIGKMAYIKIIEYQSYNDNYPMYWLDGEFENLGWFDGGRLELIAIKACIKCHREYH